MLGHGKTVLVPYFPAVRPTLFWARPRVSFSFVGSAVTLVLGIAAHFVSTLVCQSGERQAPHQTAKPSKLCATLEIVEVIALGRNFTSITSERHCSPAVGRHHGGQRVEQALWRTGRHSGYLLRRLCGANPRHHRAERRGQDNTARNTRWSSSCRLRRRLPGRAGRFAITPSPINVL